MTSAKEMRRLHSEFFGSSPIEVTVNSAPGRVNLIGEHTDYNYGFVLPTPIRQQVWVAASPRTDSRVKVHAFDYSDTAEFDLKKIRFQRNHLWLNYVQGSAQALQQSGYVLDGANLLVKGDVPQGAGLSSSAAIEIATIRTFMALNGLEIDPVELAYMGKRAENEFVGVQCGIMDQLVSSLGRRGQALLIDCQTNGYEYIPLPKEFRVVVADTKVKRELATSAYNERRSECVEGVRVLRQVLPNINSLRDLDPDSLAKSKHLFNDTVYRRCFHVVTENRRVLEAVAALRIGRVKRFGELMYESHRSLRNDYEVSCRELDILVEAAKDIPGVQGARMTGAGFGGCTVNLVESEHVGGFTGTIKEMYRTATGIEAEIYLV